MNVLMINELREKIYDKLSTLISVAEVFDWVPKRLWWFPSIYFSFDRVESSSLSNHHNERVYYFQINIFQEVSTLWVNISEKNLCSVLDEVIELFDWSYLDWLASLIDAVWGNIEPVETDVWAALHAIVLLWIHVPFELGNW